MKKIILIIFVLAFQFNENSSAQSVAWQRNQALGQGINLSGFESYWNGTPQINYTNYFPLATLPQKKMDLQLIAALGFNSVRLPVTFDHWENGVAPFTIDSMSYFFAIDSIINWCNTYNLKLIIDYHHGSLDNGNALAQLPRTTQLWQQIAQRLAYADANKVLFEIYNEPNGMTDSVWGVCANALVNAIRTYDTQKTIVLGGINWNGINELDNLVAPADSNLIYTFHFYEPFIFTHQGAEWSGNEVSTIGIPYPYNAATMPPINPLAVGTWGQNAYNGYHNAGTNSAIINQLVVAKNFETQNNLPVMCGEWGSYKTYSDVNSRCNYAAVIKNTLDSFNIPNMMWEWDQGFSFFNGITSANNIIPCFNSIFSFPTCVAAVTPSGTVSFCAGSAITLTANAGAGINYQWFKNGVVISGATSSTYLTGNPGTYYVVETGSCGNVTSNSVVVNQINNPNPVLTYTTPTTFCSPGNILLTANTFAGVTYQWQKNSVNIVGATAQSYTATSNGKYRIRETANGCTKQGSDVQISLATSVAAIISANGPVIFCTGQSVVLSVNNSIPGYNYQWKNNGSNISGATTSNYTATTGGSYTCTVSASCGNATSNAIVVSTGGIVALLNPSGTINICSGATVILNANTGPGYTFQWQKNGSNISGATSSVYNATTAGNYTVAITSLCGNATSAATTVAITTLASGITPTGTTIICNGQAATFIANTGYGYTYQWYRNGIAIAGATNYTHANSSAGTYKVIITQGGVCSATSNNAVLSVTNNPNPVVTANGPTTFCAGQNVALTANSFAGVSYQWTKQGANILGATNQSYMATTAGQYSVKETANGCTKQLGVPIVVTVNCRSDIADGMDGEAIEMKIFPNPVENDLTVCGVEMAAGDEIKIVDVVGKEVFKKTIWNPTSNCKLQTSNLTAGYYFLEVHSPNKKGVARFVKQ